MSEFEMVVAQTVEFFEKMGITTEHKLLVAVSGGVDSQLLLHIMARFWPIEQLVAVHFDHQLRDDSERDAQFVQQEAARLGVVFKSAAADVRGLAAEQKLSLEAAARRARYQFLAAAAAEMGGGYILTAHHADDQVETLLLNLSRGAGVAGLRGMLPQTVLPGAPDLILLRPFLQLAQKVIRRCAGELGIAFREDPSNQSLQFARNRIRHQLLPTLLEAAPHLKTGLLQSATILAGEEALLAAGETAVWEQSLVTEGENWVQLDRAVWLKQLIGWRRRLLRRGVAIVTGKKDVRDLSFERLEAAREAVEKGKSGVVIELGSDIFVENRYSSIMIRRGTAEVSVPQLLFDQQELAVPGLLILDGGWQIESSLVTAGEPVAGGDGFWQVVIPASGLLQVRVRERGDRYLLPSGLGHKKVSDLMVDAKLPRGQRARWPLLFVGEQLVWVPGLLHVANQVQRDEAAILLRCVQS